MEAEETTNTFSTRNLPRQRRRDREKEKKQPIITHTYTDGPSHRYIVNNSREVQSQTYSLPKSTLELVAVYLPAAGALVLLYYCLRLVCVC